ncbi:MAG: ATP-binding protein [Bacteroidales bacterium]|nr:ATP-binding protein [Bacteroidales bacterium]
MEFKRELEKELLFWKNKKNRKPLILRGARQVGKTTLVKSFAKTYSSAILLNLEKTKDASFFEKTDNVKEIIDLILLSKNIALKKDSPTLLFIDEIQESPKAIQLLRYFYEEIPELHVIAAGSLLEFAFKEIESFPVGRIEYLYLYPFNFSEFLSAMEQNLLLEQMNTTPLPKIAHQVLIDQFHKYAIIGGMPEIIKEYKKQGNISSLNTTYESIWTSYADDIEKYGLSDSSRNILKFIMKVAPNFIDQRIKFQNFGNSNYKSREVGEAFRNLDKARVLRLIYPTTSIIPPIIKDYKKSPRIQILDTGIVNYSLGISGELLTKEDFSDTYRGALMPHLIFQELISLQKYKNEIPAFWVREKSQSSAEVDMIIAYKNYLIPIEIKSGSTGSLKSLNLYMDKVEHKFAIRIYGGEFMIQKSKTQNGKEYTLMHLPYYLGTKLFEYIDYLVSR